MWEEIKQLNRVLSYLNDTTTVLGGNYPTASILPHMLARLLAVLEPLEQDSLITTRFKETVRANLDKVDKHYRLSICKRSHVVIIGS